MKYFLSLLLYFLGGCSSLKEDDWASGSGAQSSYEEQRYQEQVESVRKQVPEVRPNF